MVSLRYLSAEPVDDRLAGEQQEIRCCRPTVGRCNARTSDSSFLMGRGDTLAGKAFLGQAATAENLARTAEPNSRLHPLRRFITIRPAPPTRCRWFR